VTVTVADNCVCSPSEASVEVAGDTVTVRSLLASVRVSVQARPRRPAASAIDPSRTHAVLPVIRASRLPNVER
jgi:hypothetical protein